MAHRKRSTFAGLLLVQRRNCRLVRCLSALPVVRASLHGSSQRSVTRARACLASSRRRALASAAFTRFRC